MNTPAATPAAPEEPRKPKPLALRRAGRIDVSPDAILQRAIQEGAPLEQLEKFMQLRERHEANEARKAFNVAFADFKAESVKIIKSTAITDGPLKGKFHANLFDVVAATTPYLSKHGLTIAWKLTKDEPTWMEVTCTLRHVGGHSESVSMGGAPDTGPGRNAIQSRGSTKSYLERYTATAILGLAAQDADDDGGGGKDGGIKNPMTEEHQLRVHAACTELSPTQLVKVLKGYKAKTLADIPDSEYDSIMARLRGGTK